MNNDIKQEAPLGEIRQKPSLFIAAILGALTSLPVIALLYLGAKGAGLSFFPFDLFDWLTRVLPGNIINTGIDSEVRLITLFGFGPIDAVAKTLEQSTGIVLVIIGGAVLGLVLALAIRYTQLSGSTLGAALGVLAFLLAAAIELSLKSADSNSVLYSLLWLAIVLVVWARLLGGWLTSTELSTSREVPAEYRASRRAMLVKLAGGSLGLAVVATGLGRLLEMQQESSGAGQALSTLATPTPGQGSNPVSGAPTVIPTTPATTPAANETEAATLRDRVLPAPGTRPDLTPTADFYRIDIDTLPPVIDKASWKLQVTGLFDHPRPLTLADLTSYPAVTQAITQGCISNPVAGDLIGTVNYTGVRLRDVLKDLGLRPEALALAIQSADGFFESVPFIELMDPRTLLVYGMNGQTLPVEHGFPLRIFIPNHYGMKQPKWITSIQAINRDGQGYWVVRGWSATANPQIVSVIDTVSRDHIENGKVPVGGIAWAGDRGIQKVEVQVDDSDWAPATLRTPPLSPLTWVQWRYDWPLVRGTHVFRVRATDGTGAPQVSMVADTFPNGATGYHSVTVTL